jgi:hypothetical protein
MSKGLKFSVLDAGSNSVHPDLPTESHNPLDKNYPSGSTQVTEQGRSLSYLEENSPNEGNTVAKPNKKYSRVINLHKMLVLANSFDVWALGKYSYHSTQNITRHL